jgi:hypothetical protein
MSMAAQIAAESRRGRLLFPLKPIKQESFQGYIVRTAEWNAFNKPGGLLKALGLRPSPHQPWSRGAPDSGKRARQTIGHFNLRR